MSKNQGQGSWFWHWPSLPAECAEVGKQFNLPEPIFFPVNIRTLNWMRSFQLPKALILSLDVLLSTFSEKPRFELRVAYQKYSILQRRPFAVWANEITQGLGENEEFPTAALLSPTPWTVVCNQVLCSLFTLTCYQNRKIQKDKVIQIDGAVGWIVSSPKISVLKSLPPPSPRHIHTRMEPGNRSWQM